MAIVEWKESYSLGIPEIDAEHRELIALINEAWDMRDTTPEAGCIEAFLGEIHARIAAHFALEEKDMVESHYAEYLPHKADHERLLDEIVDLIDADHDGAEFESESFSATLEKWFAEHFRSFDARLHGALRH